MAEGATSSFTEDVTFSSRFEMTKDDDTLIISGAVVTLLNPQGDIFTNAGNDTVIVEDAQIRTVETNLAFNLGSGDDTLTVKNSALYVPLSTGSGNDIVIVNDVDINKELSLGSGDDQLELIGILNNGRGIDFGSSGTGTLRFNGGSLLGEGGVNGITNLDITSMGGTLGCDLSISQEQNSINLNGDFLGNDNKRVITIAGGNTSLHIGDVVHTNIGLIIDSARLYQEEGGNLIIQNLRQALLEDLNSSWLFAIRATDSTASLHDISISNASPLRIKNSDLTFKNVSFSNSPSDCYLSPVLRGVRAH